MKINISENIKINRQLKGMTQEELAGVLGVSPQAISKWERGDGYPDITTLPDIAGFFEISIDELMGMSRENENNAMNKINDEIAGKTRAEKFLLAKKYHEKYPKNEYFTWLVVVYIRFLNTVGDEQKLREENLDMMKECCEKVLESSKDEFRRRFAAYSMFMYSRDADREKYIFYYPDNYNDIQNELKEEREWQFGSKQKSRMMHNVNDLMVALHLLSRASRYYGKPEMSIQSNVWKYNLLKSFGGGEIPDGFCALEAKCLLRISAAYFGAGKNDDGFEYFEKAIRRYEENRKMLDDKKDDNGIVTLDLGSAFGGLKLKIKDPNGDWDMSLLYPDGEKVSDLCVNDRIVELYPNNRQAKHCLTAPRGWEWFNGVRNDPRFVAAVKRAENIAK